MKRQAVTGISPEMRALSAYIARAARKPLPAPVLERAKIHCADTLAAMLSGSRLEAGRKAAEYVKQLGGKPEASVIGARIRTTAQNAALTNGMLAHAGEDDDTHPASMTHPGRGVLPAVLAVAERNRASGMAALRAMVAGYEVCARSTLALQPVTLMHSGHYAGAFGSIFGAAAGAGALIGLDANKVRHLLSFTAQQTSGLTVVLRGISHVEKAFAGGGMPAHNGTVAAIMASHGFTGVEDVFSGQFDFLSTFSSEPDRGELVRGLGQDYEILKCAIKLWSAGGPIQGPLHVLSELMREHGFRSEDVRQLVARMPDKELAIVNDRNIPSVCVQHLLAVMLLDGTVSYSAAHDARRMRNPKVLDVRKRIKALGDPALSDKQRRWRCAMEITLNDGRKLSGRTLAAKGSYENPATYEDVRRKALDLAGPVLGRKRIEAAISAVWKLEKAPDVRALMKLVAG
jgi:2-methylcitrate dehydratase PrpD